MDALEADILEADFSEEAEEEGDLRAGEANNLSGKARLLLRRLQETGWIETEYESGTFQENITIPDYAILVMNLLYDLSQERVREYNSYVYATYASLANAAENPEYIYQALQAAYQNTVRLVDELKSLFNNIRAYYRRIPGEDDVNILLAEHFDEYKEKVFDAVYYPLKTIDSVPRFKHAIISILNEWLMNDEVQNAIVEQGVARRVWDGEESGRGEMLRIINYVIDTYEGIEEMIGEIDRKHVEYTRASVEHIRYLMNADRGTKGKLIELLKHSGDQEVMEMMADSVGIYRHRFYDDKQVPLCGSEANPEGDGRAAASCGACRGCGGGPRLPGWDSEPVFKRQDRQLCAGLFWRKGHLFYGGSAGRYGGGLCAVPHEHHTGTGKECVLYGRISRGGFAKERQQSAQSIIQKETETRC